MDWNMTGDAPTTPLTKGKLAPPKETNEEITVKWLASRYGYFTASKAGSLVGFQVSDYDKGLIIDSIKELKTAIDAARCLGRGTKGNENKLALKVNALHEAETNSLPKGGVTYAIDVALQRITNFNPLRGNVNTKSMQYGSETELIAVAEFEKKTGLKLSFTGNNQKFLSIEGSNIGGTPDGIIESLELGFEVKCPDTKTHVKYLAIKDGEDLKRLESKYYWQVQQLMLITGYKSWFWVSYDGDLKSKFSDSRLHVVRVNRSEDDITHLRSRIELAEKFVQEYLANLNLGE